MLFCVVLLSSAYLSVQPASSSLGLVHISKNGVDSHMRPTLTPLADNASNYENPKHIDVFLLLRSIVAMRIAFIVNTTLLRGDMVNIGSQRLAVRTWQSEEGHWPVTCQSRKLPRSKPHSRPGRGPFLPASSGNGPSVTARFPLPKATVCSPPEGDCVSLGVGAPTVLCPCRSCACSCPPRAVIIDAS